MVFNLVLKLLCLWANLRRSEEIFYINRASLEIFLLQNANTIINNFNSNNQRRELDAAKISCN